MSLYNADECPDATGRKGENMDNETAPVLATGKHKGKPIDCERVVFVASARLFDGRIIMCTPVNAYGYPCRPIDTDARSVATFVGFWTERDDAHAWARRWFPTATIVAHS